MNKLKALSYLATIHKDTWVKLVAYILLVTGVFLALPTVLALVVTAGSVFAVYHTGRNDEVKSLTSRS